MKRQTFLKTITAGAAAALLAPATAAGRRATVASPVFPDSAGPEDERFWELLRDQFPLTRERIYLNTGGLGASPYVVIETVQRMMDELETISETGHSEELWTKIKGRAATLLGCTAEELAFVRNTTEGINVVANGFPLGEGDEVISTTHEHVGNAVTWLALKDRKGIRIRLFEPSTHSAQENLDRIEALLTPRTRLISIPHGVTTTGLILPVKEIARMARARGIWFFVDGAQTAGMFPFSLHDIGCDAYATSGHKWLMGPKETGLLYVRREMLDTIRATSIGAYSTGEFDWLEGHLTLHPTAQRYEYGTVNVPLRAGLGAAFEFIQKIGIENVWKRDQMLSTRLFEGLRALPRVTVLSPEDPTMRSAMITLMVDGLPHLKLQEHLNTYNLRTRSVTEGGLAALRISLHIYNLPADVETVLEGVRSALKG
jgi:selenocysteine lyase/cysteine desulfurase